MDAFLVGELLALQTLVLSSQGLEFPLCLLEGLGVLHVDCLGLPLGPLELGLEGLVLIFCLVDLGLDLAEDHVESLLESEEFADDVVGPEVILACHVLEDGEEGLDLLDDEAVVGCFSLGFVGLEPEGGGFEGGVVAEGDRVGPLPVSHLFVVHR